MKVLLLVLLIFAVTTAQAVSWGWCGDGIVDPPEECDSGNENGLDTSCCFTNCTLRPSAHMCRPAAGDCDQPEYCTNDVGLCPPDVLLQSDVLCATGDNNCLLDTYCTGWSTSCPSNLAPDGKSCDSDNDLCTVQSCLEGVCAFERNIYYDDGAFCNGVETCDPETGFMIEGIAPTCDDGDSCTVDTCNHVYNMCVSFPMEGTHGPCADAAEDHAVCQYGEWQCNGTQTIPSITCVGAVYPVEEICSNGVDDNCNGLVDEGCNAASISCTSDADCASLDHSQCQAAICDFRYDHCAVVNLAEYTPCDDGLACTIDDSCDEAMCVGTPVRCDDGNECTQDSCTEPDGLCVYDSEPMFQRACNLEDNLCSINDSCNNQGECIPGNYLKCPTFTPCLAAYCDSVTGQCFNQTASGACDDQNPCTNFDTCCSGECHGSSWNPPSRGACFNAYCDVDTGSIYEELMPNACYIDGNCYYVGDQSLWDYCTYCIPDASQNSWTFVEPSPGGSYISCDDGMMCTENDVCNTDYDRCQGSWINCSSYEDECNIASCDNAHSGCYQIPRADGTVCDPGTCYTGECSGGVCIETDIRYCEHLVTDIQCQFVFCDENNPCAVYNHGDGYACVLDSDVCSTGSPTCQAGVCTPGPLPVCDPPQECGHYVCLHPTYGCVFRDYTDGTPCNVSSLCISNPTCQSGECIGSNVDCDDGNACTSDFCDPDVGCYHEALANCIVCDTVADCNTSVCHDVECVIGRCIYTQQSSDTPCPDGNVCNGDELCDSSGSCIAGSPRICDDENQCTTDTCHPVTGCTYTNDNGNSCSDGLFCTQGDYCNEGVCDFVSLQNCSASNTPCVSYTCTEDFGGFTCTPTYHPGFACDDGNPCTENDQCGSFGVCAGTSLLPPTPPNECISEYTCDTTTGNFLPVYAPAFTPCTQPDKCWKYECSPDVPGLCDPYGISDAISIFPLVFYPNNSILCATINECRISDFCNPDTGTCTIGYQPEGSPCDDQDPCSNDSECIEGWCVGVDPVVCYPVSQCHEPGECIPENGTCTQPLKSDYTPCDDGTVCTSTDVCLSGICTGVDPLDCSTGNSCLESHCDPVTGCYTTYNDGFPCDDSNDCTYNTTCLSGVCPSGTGTPIVCPSEPCQQANCLVNGGCVYSPISNCSACELASDCPNRPCKAASCVNYVCEYTADDTNIIDCVDSQFCNGLEFCDGGTCHDGTPPSCNDNNECTLDECNYGVGACTHTPTVGTPCVSNDLCALYSECSAGASCVPVTLTECGPPLPCWVSMGCDPQTGTCVYHPHFDGTLCDDNNLCTTLDVCVNGSCVGDSPVVCTPTASCQLVGVCNPATGACSEVYQADGMPCDDGLFCTSSSECQSGVCEGTSDTCDSYSLADAQCQYVICDEVENECVLMYNPDGTQCDTGNPTGDCSAPDHCVAGICTDQYAIGDVCRASTGDCDQEETCGQNGFCPTNAYSPDGTTCEANTYCWTKVCNAGACVNSVPRDCSTSIPCQIGMCDEIEDMCYTVNAPDHTSCFGTADQCVAFNECVDGSCVPSYAISGTPCDDEDACTTGDYCDGFGDCTSSTDVDCSAYDTLCMQGWCNSSGLCEAIPAHDGIECDADGLKCTVNDTCVSGQCVAGPLKDCSYLNSPCAVGVCSEDTDDEDGTCESNLTSSACNPDHCTGGCTYTVSYWAEHNSRSTNVNKRIAWPSSMERSTLCGKTWLQHVEMRPKAMAWRKLAQAYISARLNVESGACLPPSLAYILYNASTLLLDCNTEISLVDPSSGPHKDLTVVLDGYNGGIYGPGNCETESCANLTSIDNNDPCLVTPTSYYRASHVIVKEEDGDNTAVSTSGKKTKEITFRTSPVERDVCPPPEENHDHTNFVITISVLLPLVVILLVSNIWLLASRRRRRRKGKKA